MNPNLRGDPYDVRDFTLRLDEEEATRTAETGHSVALDLRKTITCPETLLHHL